MKHIIAERRQCLSLQYKEKKCSLFEHKNKQKDIALGSTMLVFVTTVFMFYFGQIKDYNSGILQPCFISKIKVCKIYPDLPILPSPKAVCL